MNKTVNINLGGMFFHIDEDAYQKLTRYFDAIKRSLSNSSGQDEIIKDIEMRIAELITEKHTNDKQVISLRELDEVIAVMGQPEDYRIDNDDEPERPNFNTTRVARKLYRDRESSILGGVLAGLGHYLGVDKVWLRIAFLILIWLYGFSIVLYIILWIIMPEAVTTAEKLEMKGEPVTISNIEKKVREEYDNVAGKIRNANYDEMGKQVRTGGERLASGLGAVFLSIFNVFAKFLGVLLIIGSIPVIIALLIGVFTLGSSAFIQFPWHDFITAGNYTDYPIWSFGVLMLFAVGIPFFYLMLLGFKLLIDNMKSIGTVAHCTLIALWVLSIAFTIGIVVSYFHEFSDQGRTVRKEKLMLKPNDTLSIRFRHSDYFAKDTHHRRDFLITQDSTDTQVIYSTNIDFSVQRTDEKTPYISIERSARGKSIAQARKTAEKIEYGYTLQGNQLILNNYLITQFANKYRDQEVDITLYLPDGTLFKTDDTVQDFDRSDDSFFNLHFSSSDYIYKVEKDQVKCINCPYDENEYNDVISHGVEVEVIQDTVNGQVRTNIIERPRGLAKDANGIVIKK
jgi:phage shock protein PspC (stress-responsive transcriptional regulator)/uncharacterized membrane protein YphA (DoxX/SURF4 family)